MNNIKSFKNIILVFSLLAASLFLLSCDGSQIASVEQAEHAVVTQTGTLAQQQAKQADPQEISEAFFEMKKKVQEMNREELEGLSEEELLELGEPIRLAAEGTIQLSEQTLKQLLRLSQEMEARFRTMTREQHSALSREVERIMTPLTGTTHQRRSFSAGQIKEILLDMNEETMMSLSSTCESLYNVQGVYVHLYPGNNLNIANDVCPAGSIFYVHNGTHTGQSVYGSKNGNLWVGVGTGGPILDGQNFTARAFNSGMKENSISWMEIRNYTEHGIYTQSSSSTEVEIKNMTFKNIAPSYDGQEHGAIMLINSKDIEIRYSYFENVASSIRIRNSTGPIKITDNEALNSGRNFFQCDKCNGAGIRINNNSMERTSSYGIAVLEDWINIYNSHGTENDWIEVNNNRARGHSNSDSGSFLILADSTGTYQEAVGNIGVSPGQVGIGVASGEHMLVEGNKMYSEKWTYSNVAYYSFSFHTPCSNHEFPASPDPNLANWICGWSEKCPVDNQWWAWASEPSNPNCGIDFDQIRANVQVDEDMDEDIWNDW